MKKLLTICLFMATVFNINAQTKEETISWLKEKLSLYLTSDADYLELKSIQECQFTVIINIKSINGLNNYHEYVIPYDGLMFVGGTISNEKDIIIDRYKEKVIYQDFTLLDIRNGETDIHSRILKATQHLLTFCPKKKEAF